MMLSTPSLAVTATITAALALLAGVRIVLWQRRAPPGTRSRGWRLALLLLAQPAWAVLLVLAIHPPAGLQPDATLTVLTGGRADAPAVRPGSAVVALPEAEAAAGVRRVPDLATALRLHPDTRVLRVLGDGLVARDLDVPPVVAVEFDPPPPVRGFADITRPGSTVAGDALRVSGRVHGVVDGAVELVDPAGVRVDSTVLDDNGRFVVQAPTFAAGPARFQLRLRDPAGVLVEEAPLHLWIDAAAAPRLRMLAGAANAETRFLRRWAVDAGLPLQMRIALGSGMTLGAGGGIDAASLAQTDVLVVDARSWAGLGAGGRASVLTAVESGMGLVLRADAPGTPAGLAGAGFRLSGGQGTVPLRLPLAGAGDAEALRARLGPGTADAPFDLEQAQAAVPALLARQLQVEGAHAIALGVAGEGGPWAWWRPHGQGRVLVWTLQDSYRLVLAGRADLHGALWSEAVATVARAQAVPGVRIDAPAFADQRVRICGAGAQARVLAPDGGASPLWPRAVGGDSCAGYWPRQPGWHRVLEGDSVRTAFHVHPVDAWPALRAARRATATLDLVSHCEGGCADTPVAQPAQPVPGPAWPWWLAWLAVSAALWWFERSRHGRRHDDDGGPPARGAP